MSMIPGERSGRLRTARGGAVRVRSLRSLPVVCCAAAAAASGLLALGAGAPAGATFPPAPTPPANSNAVVAIGAAATGAAGSNGLAGPVVGVAATTDGRGYWTVTSDGRVNVNGDARYYGSALGEQLNRPIVGMAPTPHGLGYWLVASDGGIFTYGDAGYHGSAGAEVLNKPIVGMAATPDGKGYWLVASDGGIFTYGDAPFLGSEGAAVLNKPIVGMAATPDGKGYWLVAADGGIFTFGDAPYLGSTGAETLNEPIVGMAATTDGKGYWLVGADGGIFTFGDAAYLGAGTGGPFTAPAVGIAARAGGYWIAFGQLADPSTALGQEELLAGLGYLPLTWSPLGFAWRWADNPVQLVDLWSPGSGNMVLTGAIWAFESVVGLPTDGQISPAETSALVGAAGNAAANQSPYGYTYSLAQEFGGTPQPETLTVWHDGVIVQQTPANTGIAAAPTSIGTFPVYQRLRNQVMTGTDPSGQHYADPVQFVSYFTSGDAIHYMPRAEYGYPQSLGCVEIPLGPASVIWQYTYLGSLVTVTP